MSGSSPPVTPAKPHSSDRGSAHSHNNRAHSHSEEIHHETGDARARPLVIGGIVLVVVTVFTYIFVWGFFFAFTPDQPANMRPLPTALPGNLPQGPLIEVAPNQNTNTILREQLTTLNGYGWVNEEEGVVHIPIEKAMEAVVEHGVVPQKAPERKPTPKP